MAILFTITLAFIPLIGFCWCQDNLVILKLKKLLFYRDHVLVRMLDCENEINHTLARPSRVCANTWEAPVHFATGVGSVILLPNGVVHEKSESAYVYAWEHLDENLKLIQMLSEPEYLCMDEWKKLDHEEKRRLRRTMSRDLSK